MPEVYRDVSALAMAVRVRLARRRPLLVAVDGKDGAGKSTLSVELSRTLGGTHIELDGYVRRNEGGYLNYLDYSRIRAAVAGSLARYPAVLVDGICVLEAIRRTGVVPDLHVYVKRIASDGWWAEGLLIYDPDKTPDEAVRDHRESKFRFMVMMGGLPHERELAEEFADDELIRYHHVERPHAVADIVFERVGVES